MKRGFTVIEFIVILVIIGIMLAIAIPNFKRMQERQREEKARLEEVYSNEKEWEPIIDTVGWYDWYSGDTIIDVRRCKKWIDFARR